MARLHVRKWNPKLTTLLTPEAMSFLAGMHQSFAPVWGRMATERVERQRTFLAGKWPKATAEGEADAAAAGHWQVANLPPELADRRVEILAPAHDAAALAAAWNAGGSTVVADLDDLFAPTWSNVVQAHRNLRSMVRRRSEQGRSAPVLVVRPRGLHVPERQVRVEADAMPAGLFDAGLFLFHHARALLGQGMSPHLCLPKVESAREGLLWHQALNWVEERLSLPPAAVRLTVQIESVPAALDIEAILYALRDRATGFNAGRSDYLADWLRRFGQRQDCILPYQGHLSTYTPFLRVYADRIIACAHRHGAAATGSMIAMIPVAADPAAAGLALAGIRDAVTDAALLGFDGVWVAHPHLVPVVRSAMARVMGTAPHQTDRVPRLPGASEVEAACVQVGGLGSVVTADGVRASVLAALTYLAAWLGGEGMTVRAGRAEDTATVEVARMQLWQWLRHGVRLVNGQFLTPDLYREICAAAQSVLLTEASDAEHRAPPEASGAPPEASDSPPETSGAPRAPGSTAAPAIPLSHRLAWAQEILDRLVLADTCIESWPVIALGYLD